MTNLEHILQQDSFAVSHGAYPDLNYLGLGTLYYTLTYLARAELAVCIGSGSGFVPKLMRQAQRDLRLQGKTVLIDADIRVKSQGIPDYHDCTTLFRTKYPEIEVWKVKSQDAAEKFEPNSIDYLHIDGDHSYEGVKCDFESYLPKLKRGSIVSFHDSTDDRCGVKRLLQELAQAAEFEQFTFAQGNGTTILRQL